MMHRDESGRLTLVFNDVVQNHASLAGAIGKLLGAIGSTGGPKVTWIARRFMVADKSALAAHLRQLATPELATIVPGHGAVIREHARDSLLAIADALG
jgi:hypothetical protein